MAVAVIVTSFWFLLSSWVIEMGHMGLMRLMGPMITIGPISPIGPIGPISPITKDPTAILFFFPLRYIFTAKHPTGANCLTAFAGN